MSYHKDSIEISENDQKRSEFVRGLIQATRSLHFSTMESTSTIPKIIVQFWDTVNTIPCDVKKCLETWSKLDKMKFRRVLFDDNSARHFIAERFSSVHVEAFDRCYHPAMRSDYFRLCFILSCGGCYVDADDAYLGRSIEHLFWDKRLKLQPLCYDTDTNSMISPGRFTNSEQYSINWIFYFNNNPIIAAPGDPVIGYALQRATNLLIKAKQDDLPEIQSTVGPGNITASLVAYLVTREPERKAEHFLVLSGWDTYAKSIWPLSYRYDKRNWRLSNKQRFFKK